MRLSGFNSQGANAAPMNGMGVYVATRAVPVSWHITQTIPAVAFGFPFSVRQAAIAPLSMGWHVRARTGRELLADWDVRQIAKHCLGADWLITGGVVALPHFSWSIRFRLPAGSSLAAHAGSRLTRHDQYSSIEG